MHSPKTHTNARPLPKRNKIMAWHLRGQLTPSSATDALVGNWHLRR